MENLEMNKTTNLKNSLNGFNNGMVMRTDWVSEVEG